MATRVAMPQLGETVTEGTILSWSKQVGDTIGVDEVLLEISTDKVDTEVPSPVAGTIMEILVPEGETVEVGTDLVVIGDANEAPSDVVAPAPAAVAAAPEPSAPAAEAVPAAVPAAEPPPVAQPVVAAAPSAPSTDTMTVTMPQLGETVTEGTILSWAKAVGDSIATDEVLVEISTDKVDTESSVTAGGRHRRATGGRR